MVRHVVPMLLSAEGRIMKCLGAPLCASILFLAFSAVAQNSKPAEKIVFVRPDPSITSTSGVSRSGDYRGSDSRGNVAINSVENADMSYHSSLDARRNFIAFMNPDGSGITDLHINGYDPSVSPDGTKIAYCSLRQDQYSEIYVSNADGTGEQRMTKISTGDSCGPAWSHDGKRIAFYSFALTHPSRNPAVWVMDSDGSNLRRLAEHAISPSWSPNDRQIAFASNSDGHFQIYAMNSDGTHAHRLTEDKGEDSAPAWAPDGASIVFVSNREGEHPALFLMGPNGSDQHRLIFSKRQDFCFPAWSLDGSSIAFSALNRVSAQYVAVGEELPKCEIWTGEYQMFTVDSQGRLHQLTDTKNMAMKPTYGRLVAAAH
jgi:Tol biopolymer transport system component